MKKILLLLCLFITGCSTQTSIKEEFTPQSNSWNEKHELNNDYVGKIYFESGLIDIDFVQGETNDKYLRINWMDNTYDMEGSVFMDEDCSLDSDNITIYGHYVYPFLDASRTHKFTPLYKLIDNYEENKYIKLFLKDEVRRYIVSGVYEINLLENEGDYYVDKDLIYYKPSFTKEYFENYINKLKEFSLVDTGVDIVHEDKLLTLQTCVENHPEKRLIVIAKQI